MNDKNSALVEIDLRELEIIFAQSHTRMNVISQYTNFIVILGSAMITYVATIGFAKVQPMFFLLSPLPIIIFTFLIYREDLMMVYHDLYLYTLRKRILAEVGKPPSSSLLRFLDYLKAPKTKAIGHAKSKTLRILSIFLPPPKLLSALRYGLSFLISTVCIFAWLEANQLEVCFQNCSFDLSLVSIFDRILISSIVFAHVIIFIAMFHLGDLHSRVDDLMPKESFN